MPYHLEKGPLFSVLEDVLNRDIPQQPDLTRRILTRLRIPIDPVHPDDLGTTVLFTTGQLHRPANPPDKAVTRQTWIEHMLGDWFGLPIARVETDPPPPHASLGYWFAYEGDVQTIVRETLIRAIEVSRGLEHGADWATRTRRWPIEIFWKCAQGWFEGWVTWRQHGQQPDGPGQVTVLFSTPGHAGHPVQRSPKAQPNHNTAHYQEQPTSTRHQGIDRRQGMWVVTHTDHVQVLPNETATTVEPTTSGDWSPPVGAYFQGVGPVIVVNPSERDGGVRRESRQFL